MRQYERYLFKHLLWPMVVITASLTALVWLTQILKFLDFMLSRGLSVGDFFYLTGLMLPSLLLILMPIALFIAVLFTYNRLTVESELIVLGAVGVSKWQLARPALMIGGIVAIVCYLLALYLMPVATTKFQDMRVFFRDKFASVLLEEQVFNTPVEGMTVFVRARDEHDNLAGILLHDSRDPKQPVTMLADEGKLEQGPSGPRFYLYHGLRQQWHNGNVSWLAFDDYTIDIAFYGKDITRDRKPEERSLGELFRTDGLMDKQIASFRAEAHQRLTWPLFAISLPLFALVVLFSSEFNRRGHWRRIAGAVIAVTLTVMVYFACRSLSLKHPWAVSGLYVMTVGIAVASVVILQKGYAFRMRSAPQPSVTGAA